MTRLLVASRNPHKLAELARMLPELELEPIGPDVQLPPEQGESFAEIALAKARAAAQASGRAAIGEDSGIEAEALGGAPGVRSARYASRGQENALDAENTAKLLREAPAGSPLRYVCALAYVDPAGGREEVFIGTCEGRLAEHPRGEGGFGYDPVFLAAEGPQGKTVAELSPAQKDAISHRGKAARALAEHLRARAGAA
ncbi:MAG TPA: non-canonical purine NTP pyrophosphatase [Solirubrobacteraceae bacterium]|nr:non-canonical purine NTP pyrophosphatase [Solirubrobacteraceae bacterium]